MKDLSNKPYLLRAFYEWIVDCEYTPIIVIDATNPDSGVPLQYVEDEEILFNISPEAMRDLEIDNDFIRFRASFSGIVYHISAPIKAVIAIYGEENGEGIFFDKEEKDKL